jgi:hypothetical protein
MTYKADDELQALLTEEQSIALPPQKPPWVIRIYKKSGSDGLITGEESAIFFRGHHAIADGASYYTAVLPLLFDMKPLPNCNKEFLSMWKRSEAGLTQAARALELCTAGHSSMKETESELGVELPLRGAHVDTLDRKVTLRCLLEATKTIMRATAGYVSWIFLAPYAILM